MPIGMENDKEQINFENLNENQNQSSSLSWGGKREGAGRKQGSCEETTLKYKIKDKLTDKEIDDLIKEAKSRAKTSDKILIFLLEQLFGKARQNLGVDGGEENKPLIIQIAKAIAEKNDITSIPSSNSERHSSE